MERDEGASQAYETAGLQILELAQSAYSSYVTKSPRERARLVKTVASNSTFDRGWLAALDDFRNWLGLGLEARERA